MITKKETNVKLGKKYRKILYLYPAYDNTFVFLGSFGVRQDCVTHMDSKGNILFEYIFQVPMDAVGMISDKEFILL